MLRISTCLFFGENLKGYFKTTWMLFVAERTQQVTNQLGLTGVINSPLPQKEETLCWLTLDLVFHLENNWFSLTKPRSIYSPTITRFFKLKKHTCLCCSSVGSILGALSQSSASRGLGVVSLASDASIWKLEAQVGVRDHPWLRWKFEVSLWNIDNSQFYTHTPKKELLKEK